MEIERIENMRQLHFGQLMDVYIEGNRENGQAFYPDLDPYEQILAAEQNFYQFLTEFFGGEENVYLVLSHQGRYAAALRLEPYTDGLLLEALETRPEERRKGYAEKLLRHCCRLADQKKIKIYSHIRKTNRPSIGVHEKCGFRRISDRAVYVDGSVDDKSYTYCYDNT